MVFSFMFFPATKKLEINQSWSNNVILDYLLVRISSKEDPNAEPKTGAGLTKTEEQAEANPKNY